jgi:hypothetical protein
MNDAAKLMLEAWYWMPYGFVFDLMAYQVLRRWLG